jgi:hypothetical protein
MLAVSVVTQSQEESPALQDGEDVKTACVGCRCPLSQTRTTSHRVVLRDRRRIRFPRTGRTTHLDPAVPIGRAPFLFAGSRRGLLQLDPLSTYIRRGGRGRGSVTARRCRFPLCSTTSDRLRSTVRMRRVESFPGRLLYIRPRTWVQRALGGPVQSSRRTRSPVFLDTGSMRLDMSKPEPNELVHNPVS